MAFKSSGASGRKQAPVPGPGSAAYKKIVAKQSARNTITTRKRPRSTAAFSSLKSRQAVVERIKREVWASVVKINDAIINLALAGNYNAAKALFDFAGVYSLPEAEEEKQTVNASAAPALSAPEPVKRGAADVDPVEGFFRSIGEDPAIQIPDAKAAV